MKAMKGDITKLETDVIVNAANHTLLGGGGVDGAIHRAAGPGLLVECVLLGGCKTGEVKLTKGYNLPAKYVIHTVGPVWAGGKRGEPGKLRNCYWNSLVIAQKNNFISIAFPCISTGVYNYPADQAAKIAVSIVKEYCKNNKYDAEIVFCCFLQSDLEIYQKIIMNYEL